MPPPPLLLLPLLLLLLFLLLLQLEPAEGSTSAANGLTAAVAAPGTDELGRAIAAADALAARQEFLAAVASFEAVLTAFAAPNPREQGGSQLDVAPLAQQQLARTRLGLAQSLVQVDRFAPALVLFEELLHMEISDEGAENALKGSALGGYAVALTKVGRFKQAARVAAQAARVAEQLYGPAHENTLTSRFNLAAVHEASGQMPEARAAFEAVLAARRTDRSAAGGGLDPIQLAGTLSALADVYDHMGEPEEALQLLVEARQICQEHGQGPQYRVATAGVLNNYGLVLQHLGRFDEATAAYHEALQVQETLYGPRHSSSATTKYNLAMAEMLRGGDLATSRELVADVLNVLLETHGPVHDWTMEVAAFNASLYGDAAELQRPPPPLAHLLAGGAPAAAPTQPPPPPAPASSSRSSPSSGKQARTPRRRRQQRRQRQRSDP